MPKVVTFTIKLFRKGMLFHAFTTRCAAAKETCDLSSLPFTGGSNDRVLSQEPFFTVAHQGSSLDLAGTAKLQRKASKLFLSVC
jgi:hypothetical protein